MSKARLDKVFADFIRRGEEKVPPRTFFQVLAEIERTRADNTIELRARLVGGKLQFEPSSEITVHDNEIFVGKHRIVVRVS
jgi:hypothetical protein